MPIGTTVSRLFGTADSTCVAKLESDDYKLYDYYGRSS